MDAAEITRRGVHAFSIGAIDAFVVSDGVINVGDAAQVIEGPTSDQVAQRLSENGVSHNPLWLDENCLLLRLDAQWVLFDTGEGTSGFSGPEGGKLIQNLHKAGVGPDDIDHIILTHIHPDHSWGLVDGGGLAAYSKAQIHVSKIEYEFWMTEGAQADPLRAPVPDIVVRGNQASLAPYADRTHLFADGDCILPGITVKLTSGHTPGHCSFLLESDDERLFVLGDVAHQEHLLVRNPDWLFTLDVDPQQSARTRRALLDWLVSQDLPILGFHFAYPGLGKIATMGDGFWFVSEA